MPLLETLTIHVGAAVAKAAAKVWLKDHPLAEGAAGGVVDVLKKKLEDFGARDNATMIFERVRRQVGRQLEAFLRDEFRRTPPEDLEAAALAVARAFDETSLAGIVDADLDPLRLLRALDPGPRSRFASLGGDAAEAASRLLEECCRCVVTVVGKLPEFGPAVSRTLLEREREILDDVERALQRLEQLRDRAQANDRREGRQFESNYRLRVITKLDRMEMFGLAHVGASVREYPLSVAYVTLTTTAADGARGASIDEALGGKAAIVVSGEAGSGKTTLMQWLAVRAASRDFSGALAPWNERMPFYLRLRDFAGDRALPRADQLLDTFLPNLVGDMPDAWCADTLRRGALLLVDGVDEMPAARRRGLVDWLREFMHDFGASTVVVVSSRSAALKAAQPLVVGDELAAMGFEPVTLDRMSLADSQALVAQWHEAVARALPDRAGELETYERHMQHALVDRPPIRNLASNPLLCAMVCVLNWHHARQLPDDRMELYRLALEVLLERREREREIRSAHLAHFDRKDKEAILDDLAYWMLRNEKPNAGRDEVGGQVRLSLQRMGRLNQADPEDVVQELLERSGVIRQPEAGVVDFIHRTFLEYMGARGALAFGDLDTLARRAGDSDWREVIVFACGHAMRPQRDLLVAKLLGIESSALKGLVAKFFGADRPLDADITAACCLETAARDLDPALLQALRERAARLFPPRDRTMAMRLRPAAEMDPSLLRGHAGAGEDAVAACIHLAATVGGSRMLEVVADYAAQPGPAIDLEIARAWDYFDEETYLAQVIRRRGALLGVPADALDDEVGAALRLLVAAGRHKAGEAKELANALKEMRRDHRLSIIDREADDAPAALAVQRSVRRSSSVLIGRLRSLQTLSVTTVDQEVIAALSALPALHTLRLWLPRRVDLSPLRRLPQLGSLALYRAGAAHAGDLLSALHLVDFTLGSAPVTSLNEVPLPPTLRSLELSYLERVTDFEPLQALAGLQRLDLSGARAPIGAWLHRLQALEQLEIVYPYAPTSFDGERLAALRSARTQGTPLATCLSVLRAPNLETMRIASIPDWPADGRVAIRPPADSLNISGDSKAMRCLDLGAWPGTPDLRSLWLQDFDQVLNADRLADWPELEFISLQGCRQVDLSPAVQAELATRSYFAWR